jgi:transcriptional regulator with XRE-family HTH domain
MSTHLLCNLNNTLCRQYVIHYGVGTGREALADYVRRSMGGERSWSTHEVARRAKAKGFTLSNGTVQNILKRKIKNVQEETLRGLAAAFGDPPEIVFQIYLRGDGQNGDGDQGRREKEKRAQTFLRALPDDKLDDVLLFVETLARQYPARGAKAAAAPRPAKAARDSKKAEGRRKRRA